MLRALTHDLAEGPFAATRRLRCAGIAEMRVVRPDNHLAAAAAAHAVMGQREQRVGHVGVAQIPCVQPASEHPTVVRFCIDHHLRVLLGEELRIERVGAIAREVVEFVGAQLQELAHCAGLRGGPHAKRHRIAVGLRLAHMVQRRVAFARQGDFARVHVIQIADHRVGGPVEAVEIETLDSPLAAAADGSC